MPGLRNMLMGVGWFLIGVVLTVLSFAMPLDGVSVLFWGAMVAGPIQFVVGLVQWLGYQVKGPQAQRETQLVETYRAVVRCMVAMAIVDGELQDEEVAAISAVHAKFTGRPLDKAAIQAIAKTVNDPDNSALDSLSDISGIITDDMKSLVVRMSLLVLVADGDAQKKELKFLDQIAGAVRIPVPVYRAILDEFRD